MLIPLQPLTPISMTSLSALADIMLACHRCDLWPRSPLSAPTEPLTLPLNRRSPEGAQRRLGLIGVKHQSSGIGHQSVKKKEKKKNPRQL